MGGDLFLPSTAPYVGQQMIVDKGATTITTSQRALGEPCSWPGRNAGNTAHLTNSESVDPVLGSWNVEMLLPLDLETDKAKAL